MIKYVFILLATGVMHASSIVEYVDSLKESDISYVQHYTVEDNRQKDAPCLLYGEKEELIRAWIDNTTTYQMNN